MIRSFKNNDTRQIFDGNFSLNFPAEIQLRAKACLDRIHAAMSPRDLIPFRSLRIEKLKGNRKGQYSIRVNKQYRICFSWVDRYAIDVELTDYH